MSCARQILMEGTSNLLKYMRNAPMNGTRTKYAQTKYTQTVDFQRTQTPCTQTVDFRTMLAPCSRTPCTQTKDFRTMQTPCFRMTVRPGVSASGIRVVRAARDHILPLARHMRAADRHEVMASHGQTPFEALCIAFAQSTLAWTLLLDGTPAMMWGVAPGCTGVEHDSGGEPEHDRCAGMEYTHCARLGDSRNTGAEHDRCTGTERDSCTGTEHTSCAGPSGPSGQAGQSCGIPWMLGADSLHGAGLAIARQSRQYVACMQRVYPYLENYVHSANLASIRWLLWCGFSLAPDPEPYGSSGELFYHFWRHHV